MIIDIISSLVVFLSNAALEVSTIKLVVTLAALAVSTLLNACYYIPALYTLLNKPLTRPLEKPQFKYTVEIPLTLTIIEITRGKAKIKWLAEYSSPPYPRFHFLWFQLGPQQGPAL